MKFAILSISLLLLTACTSTGPESQIGTQAKADRQIKMTRTSDCVFHSTISGFEALDDRYVVLFSQGRRKAYLAEISAGCFDVKSQYAARRRGRRRERADLRLWPRLRRIPPYGHGRRLPHHGNAGAFR